MIKLARILEINSHDVQLHLESNDKCADCNSGCSDGFLGFLFPKNTTISVSKKNELNANSHLNDRSGFFTKSYRQGDIIGIKFNENQLFKLALVLYGLPILLIVVSLVLFTYLFATVNINPDMGGVFGLIIGLILSKVVIKHNQNKFKPQVEFFK